MGSTSDLRKGVYMMHQGEPHRVTKKEVVVVGTHSHTKLKIFLKPMSGGGERIATIGHEDNVEILDIIRKKGQLISKNNGKVQVMDSVSFQTFDADIDSELYDQVNENDEVIFVDYNNAARVLEKR